MIRYYIRFRDIIDIRLHCDFSHNLKGDFMNKKFPVFIVVVLYGLFCFSCKDPVGNQDAIAVRFQNLTANGSISEQTSALTLTFNQDIPRLSAADITLDAGDTGAVKGAVTRSAKGTYSLAVTGVTKQGSVTVSVKKTGYVFSGNPQTAVVYPEPVAVTFSSLAANGSATAQTNALTLTFSQDITGLSAGDITLEAGTTGAVKGELTRSAAGTYSLAVTGVTAEGSVTVSVAKTGYAFSGSKTVTVYPAPSTGPHDIAVTFSSLIANGSATAQTNALTLTFSQDITGLAVGDITLEAGTTGAVKGELTRSAAGTYSLAVTGVTAEGSVTVSVAKTGYDVSGSPQTVTVYPVPSTGPQDIAVSFNSLTADGSATAQTTALRLTFSQDISDLAAGDITLDAGDTGAVKGALTRIVLSSANPCIYSLAITGVTTQGTITVSVAKTGYDVSGNPQTATVYPAPSTGPHDIAVTFLNLAVNGSSSAQTNALTLTFDKDIENLSAGDITLESGTTGAVKGALTRSAAGTYSLAVTGVTAQGTVTVSVAKTGYVVSGNPQTVTVYPGFVTVTFSSLSANGSSSAQTTTLTLMFSQDITGLTADDITLGAGTTGAVKGALTKATATATGTYSLAVSGVTTQGIVSVSVSKTGYTVSGNPKTATVYPAPSSQAAQVELVTASNSGVPAYRFTPNAGETWSNFKEITFKVRVDDNASYNNTGGRLHVYGFWSSGFANGWMGLGGGWDATLRLIWYQKGLNGVGTASTVPISTILGKNTAPPSSLVGQWVTYTLSIANNATDNVYIGNYNGDNYPAGTSTGPWILGAGLTTNSGAISYYIKDVALVRKDNTQLNPDAFTGNSLGSYSISQNSSTDVTRTVVDEPGPPIAVTFNSLTADGSASAQTTALTLQFSQDITNLAAGDITLNAGITGAVKGALTKGATAGTYSLAVTGVTTQSSVTVSVEKTGYIVSGGPKTVPVYPAPVAVTFNSLSADGSVSARTTALTLTFSQDITGLAAGDITLESGSTGAAKGALTPTGTGTYSLGIWGVTAQGSVTVSVAKTGYAFSGSPKTVPVYPSPFVPGLAELITASNSGVPAYRFTPNAGETWSNFKEITFTVRVDDTASYNNTGGRLHVYGFWSSGFANGWMGLGGGWDSTLRLIWYQKGPNGVGEASTATISTILGKNAAPPSSLVGQWVTYTLSIANNATDNVYIGNYNGANYPAGTSTGPWILGAGLTTNNGTITYYIKDVALVRKDNTQLRPAALEDNFLDSNFPVSISQNDATNVTRSVVDAPSGSAPTAVTFNSLTASNSASAQTTALTLQFSQDITGLDASDITLSSGTTGAVKGALTRTGTGTYSLGISGVTAENIVMVSVIKTGYAVSGNPKTATVYPVPPVLLHTKWPFKVGAAVSNGALSTTNGQYPLLKHFNVLVAENEMKPQSVMPWNKPATFPGTYSWTNADKYVTYAKANNASVRGHVLVWHAQTPDYFFDVTGSGDTATTTMTKDVLYDRMEKHIKTVFEHFKGDVGWWDVCNEVIGDNGQIRAAGNPSNGGSWYTKVMENSGQTGMAKYEFILKAFQFARQYADANGGTNVKLYLTDYNIEFYTWSKHSELLRLVDYLIANDAPIDGVGFQTHINYTFDVNNLSMAIDNVAAKTRKDGVKLMSQVTELDMSVFNNDDLTLDDATLAVRLATQATKYRALFDIFKQKYEAGKLDMVVLWGVNDANTWLNGRPQGRVDHPLLFDRNSQPKPAFNKLVE
jgi:endo-1,4-beta-xylanase